VAEPMPMKLAFIPHSGHPSGMAMVPEHRADEDANHRAAQVVIPRQPIPKPMRQRQHPLTYRHRREHMVDVRAFDEWAALQTDPRVAGWGRRIFEGQPADWPAGAPSNEDHGAVTARQQK